jgi:hypothetical protein
MNKKRTHARPEYNQHPKPARFPIASPRDPLLDDATSQIGRNQTAFTSRIASQSLSSPIALFRAKRPNALFLNIRISLQMGAAPLLA